MSGSLRPHESQHARPPCPSPTPGVHSDSRPSSRWCHPAISSYVFPFSSCPQSLPASESFPMSQVLVVSDVTSHYLHTGSISQDLVWKGTILGCENKEAWIIRGHFGGWLPHYNWLSLFVVGMFHKVTANTELVITALLLLRGTVG